MLRGLTRRLIGGLAVLLAVSVATFALSFLLPADPARMVAGPSATVATVTSIRHELGLDRPLPVQYVTYLGKLLHGNLGRSFKQNIDVTTLVASRFGATFLLMLAGIAFELLLGLPAGILAALRPGSWLDRAIMSLSFLGVSAPQFVLGLMLLYFLAFRWPLFPLGGSGTFMHLVLPAFTLGVGGAGWYARMVRSSLLDALGQDYVRTAAAKGVGPRRVVGKHALKNALLPLVTMIGLDVGTFMGGVIVVESVFGWPGLGKLTWDAIRVVDIPVIMGVVQVSAVMIVLGNLLADAVYPLIDPQVRFA